MDVYNHYQGLLAVFVKCAGESGFKTPLPRISLKKLKPPAAIWSQLELKDGYLKLTTDIAAGSPNGFAEEWGLADGELEILIHPTEQIRTNDPWSIKRSQVEIAYLYYNTDMANPEMLLCMHFDYSVKEDAGEPADAHPLFHVTLTHNPIQLGDILKERHVDTTRMRGLPVVRVPTAHMGLPSVLLNVAADHFLPVEFTKFLRHVRSEAPYPTMANDLFTTRMDKEKNRMRSCAWYADLPAVAV